MDNIKNEFTNNFKIMIIVLIITSIVFYISDGISFTNVVSTKKLMNGDLVKVNYFNHKHMIIKYNLTKKQQISVDFNPKLYNSLNWLSQLSNKTRKGIIVYNWWPEGNYINAFTKFKSVIYSISPDYMLFMSNPKWNTLKQGNFCNRNKFKKILKSLVSSKVSLLINNMKSYNASFLYLTIYDLKSEKNMISYLKSKSRPGNVNKLIKNSNLYNALTGQIKGLHLIYKDNYSVIYSIIPLSELKEKIRIKKNKNKNYNQDKINQGNYPPIRI